jgi:hypothetical protein
MQRFIFELSMPSNNAWNKKWSGESNTYTIAKKVTEKRAKMLGDYYSYAFGDGWVAGVTVRKAKQREKATNKFCGYDWMVNEILWYNEIRGARK